MTIERRIHPPRTWSCWLAGLLAVMLAPASAIALDAGEVFTMRSPSLWTVLVHDDKGRRLSQGSSVVVAPERVITNCHVIEKGKSIFVQRENVRYGATVELQDPERDLCQLKVSGLDAPVVDVAEESALRVGARVYAIGSPRGLEMTLSDGLISALRRDDRGALEFVQTTAPVSPGSSGGGLFDAEGRLIGITTKVRREAQNLNFAVPASLIAELPARSQAREQQQRQRPPVAADAGPQKPDRVRRVGDWFDYVIVDDMTQARQRVALRVDRVMDGRVVINGGARIEDLFGAVVEAAAPLLAELDYVTPPGGWAPAGRIRESGRLEFKTVIHNRPASFDLGATVSAEENLRVNGIDHQVVRIDLQGWHARVATDSVYQFPIPVPYQATLWFAPELQRVVRFKIERRSTSKNLQARETIELEQYGRY